MEPYDYLLDARFSSETFKVELKNLPKFFGFAELKKFLEAKHKLLPHKIKYNRGRNPHVFLNFKSEKEQNDAIVKLNGFLWKKHNLIAKVAKPAADPYITSQKNTKIENTLSCINDIVTPYWKIPYDQQIKFKDDFINNKMQTQFSSFSSKKIDNQSLNIIDNDSSDIHPKNEIFIEKIKTSPLIEGYRNKCEFTISYRNVNIVQNDTNEKVVDNLNSNLETPITIGFRLGAYKYGCNAVESPDECLHVNKPMKVVVKKFESLLRDLKLPAYNPVDKSGTWSQLTLRSNQDNLVMAILHANKIELEKNLDVSEMIEKLKSEFEHLDVVSLYLQLESQRIHTDTEDSQSAGLPPSNKHCQLIHVRGENCIFERLCGMKFRISPNSFFQVNIAAFEVMLRRIQNYVEDKLREKEENNENVPTVLLDVCCGTGTIGQYLAQKMGDRVKVIGIDICQAAIEDAEFNASLNGLTSNTQYICRSADDGLINTILPQHLPQPSHNQDGAGNVIAILDPPRSGVTSKVIHSLRNVTSLTCVIYVSCDIGSAGASKNIVDLIRSPSKRLTGPPFSLKCVAPVDMFPQTLKFETIVFMERGGLKP